MRTVNEIHQTENDVIDYYFSVGWLEAIDSIQRLH